jgi:hypothetical protein
MPPCPPPDDIVPMFRVTVLPLIAVTWPYFTLLLSEAVLPDPAAEEADEAAEEAAEEDAAEAVPAVPQPAMPELTRAAAEMTAAILLNGILFLRYFFFICFSFLAGQSFCILSQTAYILYIPSVCAKCENIVKHSVLW